MVSNLKNRIVNLLQKTLVQHTLSMLASRGIGILLQGAYFTIIARTLGVNDYGLFVGVAAFVGILNPFSSLGFGKILIQNVARNHALFGEYWGNALFMSFTSGGAIAVLATAVGYALLPDIGTPVILPLIAVADLIFYQVYKVAIDALNSLELIHWIAKLGIAFRLSSLIGVLCLSNFWGNSNSGVTAWAIIYLVVRIAAALSATFLVCRMLGRPKLALSRIPTELKEGFYFSIGSSSATIYNDIDKSMLARMSTLEATGIYGAAYRIITVAVTPVFALLASTYASFFRQGKNGIRGSLNVAKRLVPIAGLYGAMASFGLIVLAPLIPYVLGNEYSNSVNTVRWLAPLVFFKPIQLLAADTLTGAGFQGLRSTTQLLVAAFNTLANLWLIPLYSWKGAVWSSLASDGLLVLILWALVFFMTHQKNTNNRMPSVIKKEIEK